MASAPQSDICIVGGGMAGLVLAYQLSKNPAFKIKIFERAPFWGGADASAEWNGLSIERHYHHYFSHDKEIIRIIHELGLEDKLVWYPGKTGILRDNGWYDLAPLKFLLGFKPLSIFDRLKFLFKVLKIITSPKINENDPRLAGVSAADWSRKFFGPKLADTIWVPLLKSKFGSSYENIDASFLYGRIYNRVSSRQKGQTKELLGYLLGSSTHLINALVAAIQRNGGQTFLGNGVQKIHFQNNQAVSVEDQRGQQYKTDWVVLAVQTPAASSILRASDCPAAMAPEVRVLESVKYQQVISAIFFMKESLIPYYWLNIADSQYPFPVLVEQTRFITPDHYRGTHILYASTYRDPQDEMYKKSDEELRREFTAHLQKINPAFDPQSIQHVLVSRERFATPVYEKNFKSFMTPARSTSSNLFYLNGTQVFPDSRNVNKMVSLGNGCLEAITREALQSAHAR